MQSSNELLDVNSLCLKCQLDKFQDKRLIHLQELIKKGLSSFSYKVLSHVHFTYLLRSLSLNV